MAQGSSAWQTKTAGLRDAHATTSVQRCCHRNGTRLWPGSVRQPPGLALWMHTGPQPKHNKRMHVAKAFVTPLVGVRLVGWRAVTEFAWLQLPSAVQLRNAQSATCDASCSDPASCRWPYYQDAGACAQPACMLRDADAGRRDLDDAGHGPRPPINTPQA